MILRWRLNFMHEVYSGIKYLSKKKELIETGHSFHEKRLTWEFNFICY